jgi:hypothetical protein
MPMNDEVLTAVRRTAILEGPHSGYAVDGYEVRTHPDLVDRLRELMAYTPGARFGYVFGTPTLQNPTGEIFATASGTSSLYLRLEGDTDWGRPYEEYGAPWRQGNAWEMGRPHSKEAEERLARLVRVAYSSVQPSGLPDDIGKDQEGE